MAEQPKKKGLAGGTRPIDKEAGEGLGGFPPAHCDPDALEGVTAPAASPSPAVPAPTTTPKPGAEGES